MKLDQLLASANDTLTVRRVYGEPLEKDGVTLVPVATVAGGGGGGGGHDAQGQEGEGGGFGLAAKPAGVYVIERGKVRWIPAVDVNRLAMTVAAAVAVLAFARVRAARIRSKG